jgi:periplasmic divalent cation tolerance protein
MFRMIFVTAPVKDAEKLGRQLLEERLIACVNFIPHVKSLFWWKGEIDHADEVLMILKAPAKGIGRLKKRIAELHSYEVPEIVVLRVKDAWEPYAKWVKQEATGKIAVKPETTDSTIA